MHELLLLHGRRKRLARGLHLRIPRVLQHGLPMLEIGLPRMLHGRLRPVARVVCNPHSSQGRRSEGHLRHLLSGKKGLNAGD